MKKTTKILVVLVALIMVLTVVFAACQKTHVCGHKCPICDKCTDADCNDPVCADKCPGHAGDVDTDGYKGYLANLDRYLAYTKFDLEIAYDAIGKVSTEIDAKVDAAYQAGLTAIGNAKNITEARKALSDAKTAMANCIPLANGMKSYTASSADAKTEIMGKLEAYAVRNSITGITMFENGGYQIFNERVVLGTENYILGYGFGTLAEGSLNADLASEENVAWKRYYHGLEQENPGTINALNEDGSIVSDLYDLIAGSYYGTFMNETKDGYVWTPILANNDPEPVGGLDANGQARKWRFEIRSGLKYDTLGKYKDTFAGMDVQPEDFLTPYKLLFNQANGLFRGKEAAGQSGAQYIVGSKEYYEATKDSNKGVAEGVDFSGVGVKVEQVDGKWYFEYELDAALTPYYARYYIASSLYSPVPASFITAVGGIDNYLGYDEDGHTTPVDNSLSVGPYTLEAWDDGQIVFKKNPYFALASSKYQIAGIHYNVFPAITTDNEAGFREFLAGHTDASGIPEKYLSEYVANPRTKTTMGTTCYKLNINALDAATWEYMFGESGVITQTPKTQYWNVKPIMSNNHFIMGLSYALNRQELAANKGMVASASYLSPNYLSDPENGKSYNATQAHKDALASIVNEDTDAYGYSLELAREYFRMALDELEATGAYTPGTKENPTVINLTCMWYLPVFEEPYFKPLKQYWETAFNDNSVSGGKYKLNVEFYAPATPSLAYDMMKTGQFDIGFGSITGNPQDVLDFLSILSSTPTVSSGWTLNWGLDTSSVNSDYIVYDGMRWSYDALQQAGVTLVAVQNGELGETIGEGEIVVTPSTDKLDVTITIPYNKDAGIVATVDKLVFFYDGDEYDEWSILATANMNVVDDKAGKLTITASVVAAELAKINGIHNRLGIDVYLSYTAGGQAGETLVTVMLDNYMQLVGASKDVGDDPMSVAYTLQFARDDLVSAVNMGALVAYYETATSNPVVLEVAEDNVTVTDEDGLVTVVIVLDADMWDQIPDGVAALYLGVDGSYTLVGAEVGASTALEISKPVAPAPEEPETPAE